jgi:hypothetical protein
MGVIAAIPTLLLALLRGRPLRIERAPWEPWTPPAAFPNTRKRRARGFRVGVGILAGARRLFRQP